MDRRYLLATLAIVATFAIVSHELRDGRFVVLAGQRIASITGRCGTATSAPARIVSEVTDRLRPSHPEEAQMLAEMNLPLVRAQAQAAALAVNQQVEASRCARETALREAERARRDATRARQDAIRMRQNMASAIQENSFHPIVFRMERVDRQNQRLQQAVKVQFTEDQVAQFSQAVDLAVAKLDTTDFEPLTGNATSEPRCPASRSWSQMQDRYKHAMRNALHAIQNSVHSKTAGIGDRPGYL
jgi:hypothetical protein